ncbi:MAG TPA: hypothetical protein VM600_03775 [Actinomycetota bacterium]|nr:hypothetical protein [Actinomycetota bacterium]
MMTKTWLLLVVFVTALVIAGETARAERVCVGAGITYSPGPGQPQSVDLGRHCIRIP